jgi:adenosine deaminase
MPRSLRDLPKCELHVHLEGAMRIGTLSDLCAKHGVDVPEDTRGKMYDNFDAFASAYRAACECLRERDDVFRVVREHLEDAVEDGCAWVEVAPSLLLWCQRFDGLEATILLLLEAAAAAEDAVCGKAACAYIFSAERHEPPENAVAMATVVGAVVASGRHLIHGRAGIVGFGLHSAEPGNPPAPFADAFRIAAAAGLSSFPHAGELAPGGGISGADSVRSAIDDLGARRIGHGVLCHCDAPLVARLAREDICLDCCPSSNVLLKSVPSMEERP